MHKFTSPLRGKRANNKTDAKVQTTVRWRLRTSFADRELVSKMATSPQDNLYIGIAATVCLTREVKQKWVAH